MVITFYSYKGGVGRSMALANVAELLAQRGYSVVVCDWDLEAPGLERFLTDDEHELNRFIAQPGIIDLIQEYKEAGHPSPGIGDMTGVNCRQGSRYSAIVSYASLTPARSGSSGSPVPFPVHSGSFLPDAAMALGERLTTVRSRK